MYVYVYIYIYIHMYIYIYIYIHIHIHSVLHRLAIFAPADRPWRSLMFTVREFAKGGLVKGGLAIDSLPLCNCNTLGSIFNVETENMPNC